MKEGHDSLLNCRLSKRGSRGSSRRSVWHQRAPMAWLYLLLRSSVLTGTRSGAATDLAVFFRSIILLYFNDIECIFRDGRAASFG